MCQKSDNMMENEQIIFKTQRIETTTRTGLQIQASIQMFCILLYKDGCCGLHDQQLLASVMFVCCSTYLHGYLYISARGIAPVNPSVILHLFSTHRRV